MTKFLTLLFTISFINLGFGQDSLVYYEDLSFNSDFEKIVFEEYFIQNKENYLALFMALSSKIKYEDYESAKNIFDVKFKNLNTEKLQSKREDKRVKSVYEGVHKDFFDQYKAQNQFYEIFETGRYNCVSASALYGIFFDQMNIPYIIKEKPTHVYLMAYPKSERIVVESTDPSGGYIKYNTIYKQAYVDRLAKAKLISSSEINSKSTDALFDQYYFYDQDITLAQLVGIQYMNDALYRIENKDIEGAFTQMEKARMFYKTDKVATLMLALGSDVLANQKYEELKYIDYLLKVSRFKYFGIDNEIILGEFRRIIQTQLIEKGDAQKLSTFYTKLDSGLTNIGLKIELGYVYNYEQGRALYNQGKYPESLNFFEPAYSLKPTNLDINNVLINALSMSMQTLSNQQVIKKLETYYANYPSLLENNLFKSILANCYLIQVGISYDLNNEKDGTKYRALFEKYYEVDLNLDKNNLGRSYSIAAVYYFRKEFTSKAKFVLNEGLKIDPENYQLLVRKNMIH
jgi:hypothetical protein